MDYSPFPIFAYQEKATLKLLPLLSPGKACTEHCRRMQYNSRVTALCTASRYLYLRDVARFMKESQDIYYRKLAALSSDLQKLSLLLFSAKSIKQLFSLSKGRAGTAVYFDYTVTVNRWYICNIGKYVMFPLPKLLPTGISTTKQKCTGYSISSRF